MKCIPHQLSVCVCMHVVCVMDSPYMGKFSHANTCTYIYAVYMMCEFFFFFFFFPIWKLLYSVVMNPFMGQCQRERRQWLVIANGMDDKLV